MIHAGLVSDEHHLAIEQHLNGGGYPPLHNRGSHENCGCRGDDLDYDPGLEIRGSITIHQPYGFCLGDLLYREQDRVRENYSEDVPSCVYDRARYDPG